MQGWCWWMVARLRSSNPGSDFSLPLGSILQASPIHPAWPGPDQAWWGQWPPPAQSCLCSGTKIWQGSLVSALQKSPYCALELLVLTWLQPVLQQRASRGNWHDWGTGVMMEPSTLCWGSLACPPSALSLQLPYPESSSHSR